VRVCLNDSCETDISHRPKIAKYCSRRCKDAVACARNRPALLARQARYRASHKVERSAYDRALRLADPGANKARLHAYYADNKLAFQQARDKRRAIAHGVESIHYTAKDWRGILRQYHDACAYCGSTDRIELEHVIPIARGGRDAIGNIVPACYACNRSKWSKFYMEWKLHKIKLAALAAA